MRTRPAFPAAVVRLRGSFAQAMLPNQPRLDLERRVTRLRTMAEVFADSRSGGGILGAFPAREVRGLLERRQTPLRVGGP